MAVGIWNIYVCVCVLWVFYNLDLVKYSTFVFRLLKLKEIFNSKFGSIPKFYVRAPGRVNIIGISKVSSLCFFPPLVRAIVLLLYLGELKKLEYCTYICYNKISFCVRNIVYFHLSQFILLMLILSIHLKNL